MHFHDRVAGVRHGAASALYFPYAVAHATFKAQNARRAEVLALYRAHYARSGGRQWVMEV